MAYREHGDGGNTLPALKGVAAFGSLNKAAKETKISYYRARCVLGEFEEAAGLRLMKKKVGGRSGGGSWLTGSGKRFVGHYERFCAEALDALDELFKKHFAG